MSASSTLRAPRELSDTGIWLIRHGQSAANAGDATDHPITIALTDLGHQQAQDVAQKIPRAPDWVVVSPFQRTLDTAQPTLARFPGIKPIVWPIQELTYLSPVRCRGTTSAQRQDWARAYWEHADPHWNDGDGAESYAEFTQRLVRFRALLESMPGFGLVFGHGMFFKGFLIGLEHGFDVSASAMKRFRALESADPVHNGQIVVLDPTRLKGLAS